MVSKREDILFERRLLKVNFIIVDYHVKNMSNNLMFDLRVYKYQEGNEKMKTIYFLVVFVLSNFICFLDLKSLYFN